MSPENFGKNLALVLDQLGLSQLELSKRAGLTQSAISQIIHGKREPALSTIVAILNAIPVKFERLVR